jgi:hypothetical protein
LNLAHRSAASVASFNGTLRYELWDVELFDTLLEAKVLIERWRVEYNTIRPHSSLGYRPPTPEAIQRWSESARRSLPKENLLEQDAMLTLRVYPEIKISLPKDFRVVAVSLGDRESPVSAGKSGLDAEHPRNCMGYKRLQDQQLVYG